MSETISGYYTTVLTLSPSNPSLTFTGTVEAGGSLATDPKLPYLGGFGAVYGPDTADFTITNDGLIDDSFATLTSADNAGIVLGAAGTVFNQATILSETGTGVYLYAGGVVSNTGTIIGNEEGVSVGHGSVQNVIENSGLIDAPTKPFTLAGGAGPYISTAEFLWGSGTIDNAATGTIAAQYGEGISLFGEEPNSLTDKENLVSATAVNAGTIQAAYGAEFTGIGTFSNTGRIFGSDDGVELYAEGTLDNSGSILAGGAGAIGDGISSIINSGTIASLGTTKLTIATTISSLDTLQPDGIALIYDGSISNTSFGIISSAYGNGIYLAKGGSLNNAGDIFGKDVGVLAGANATIANTGTISGTGGVAVSLTGSNDRMIENPGAVLSGLVDDSNGSGTLELAAGGKPGTIAAVSQFIGFTTIDVDAGAVWDFAGAASVSSKIVNNGSIFETAADALTIGGNVSGSGVIILDPTTLTLNGSVTGQQISFVGAGDVLALGDSRDFHGTITGFGISDSIILVSPSNYTDVSFEDGVLTIVELTGTTEITFADPSTFVNGLVLDAGTSVGTDITITAVTCFVAGTRIATPGGQTVVESLRIGDLVCTQHAGDQKIKWIGHRSYEGRFIRNNPAALPICIKQHAIAAKVPARDLWVSPGHAISIDGVLIHAGRLVNSVSIIQAEAVDAVTYFHIELENHEIIFAENCPAETFMDEHFRQQFQNAAEFAQRYPGGTAPHTSCQPRLTHGFHLHAIQTRINARAGIAAPRVSGPLRGYVDRAGPDLCFGWAQDISAPEEPVCLDILERGRLVGRVLANLHRADVRNAGHGSGYHGFEFQLPADVQFPIKVRRSCDQAELASAVIPLRKVQTG